MTSDARDPERSEYDDPAPDDETKYVVEAPVTDAEYDDGPTWTLEVETTQPTARMARMRFEWKCDVLVVEPVRMPKVYKVEDD